jgi:predicted nucleotidyltransferase
MNTDSNFDKTAGKLVDYFTNETKIIGAYIFGSFGTERQTPLSDLDIAIFFDGNIPLMEELKLTAELSSLLKFEKIDLVNLNKAPVYLQHEILSKGVKIFDRMPERTQDFIENMLEIFHDYQGILKKYREDLREGLLEDYLNGR